MDLGRGPSTESESADDLPRRRVIAGGIEEVSVALLLPTIVFSLCFFFWVWSIPGMGG